MKTQCPHCQKVFSVPDNYKGKRIKCISCRKVLVAEPIIETAKLQVSEQSAPPSSHRNRWIMAIIIFVALAWIIGFACGALLTRTNREEAKASIATIEAKAEKTQTTLQQKMQTAKAENRQLRNELKRAEDNLEQVTTELTQVRDELATEKANVRRLKSKFDSNYTSRLAGKQNENWEIVDIKTKITERNDVYWQFAWRLTVKNNLAHAIHLSGELEFQDADRFVLDTDTLYGIIVPASSSKTFTGAAMVTTRVAPKVATTYVKLSQGLF